MTTPLRALMVEDSENDADLLVRELRRAGYEVTHRRVDTADALRAALTEEWAVVFSDYSMPELTANDALSILKETGLDIPFIIVSGTVGEETAVEALKAGAHDFLVKGRPARLIPALQRELREAGARRKARGMERSLRESEARFRRLAESGVVGILIAERTGKIVDANDTFLQLVGYSREELEAGLVNWSKMTPTEWSPLNATATEQLRTRGVALPWEKEYIRKDGTRVPVLVGVATLDGSRNISISLDLTERRRLESQLHQVQRLEAIGSLAGGIAHDFNNLLSVILGYTDLILDDLKADDPLRGDMEEVKRAGERAGDLTRQLLAFSRQQMLQPRVLDLEPILAGMANMLRRLLGETVDLSIQTATRTGKLYADPGQIEQVVMNLAVNARDAMRGGGKLCIEAGNVQLDDAYAAQHPGVTAGAYVMLAVTDAGTGMDAATQQRMFEPFFTTKEQGKGTGLGLATVFGIVKQSGGHISVWSEVGRGTTFKLYFPRSDRTPELVSIAPPPATLRGGETVLLVEDEDQVRALARTILARAGYDVLQAASGGDALVVSEQYAAKIHLLVTDVVMPRMSGKELADRLVVSRPGLKVLYMSGYTDSSIVDHGVLDPGVAFLQKPITPDVLLRKVREALESA